MLLICDFHDFNLSCCPSAHQDPEALAQLMKSMPLTNDGKFYLLESETGDEAEAAGPDELESEA